MRDFLTDLRRYWWALFVGGGVVVGARLANVLGFLAPLPMWAALWLLSISLLGALVLMWRQQHQDLKALRSIPGADRTSIESLPATAGECCEGLGAFDVGAAPYQNAVSTLTSLRMAGARLVLWPDVADAVRRFTTAGGALVGDLSAPRSGRDAPAELDALKVCLSHLVESCRDVLATGDLGRKSSR